MRIELQTILWHPRLPGLVYLQHYEIAENLFTLSFSLFKLLVPLTESHVCKVAPNSEQANYLRTVKIFIIDEVSMIPCYTPHKSLRDIMEVDVLFGDKMILLRGDFKQILPVFSRVPPSAVVDDCLKRSNIWHNFLQRKLTPKHMSANDKEQ